MIRITDKARCSGCTACQQICPADCIRMEADSEGFLYPNADAEKCVECGACTAVCPVLNRREKKPGTPDAFAVRTRRESDLRDSTSGGVSSALTHWAFSRNGRFWAASYDENWTVRHMEFAADSGDLQKMRGSKYVQSELGDAFRAIRTELDAGLAVCFVGTPCQVYGLKAFLGQEYENLLTADIVCHGVPSPKLWAKYVAFQEKKYAAPLVYANFRYKTYGYHSGTMRLEFKSGKRYSASARTDFMLRCFFGEIASRPSCYQCAFKERNRVSDLTLFDCWHFSDLVPGTQDDDRGYTNVLAHTEKGRLALTWRGAGMVCYPINAERAIALDGSMTEQSATPHPAREQFYGELERHDLAAHVQSFLPVSVKDYVMESCKPVMRKLGLTQLARRILHGKGRG